MEFKDFPLSEVGTSVQLVGGVWASGKHTFLVMFPEYDSYFDYDIVLADGEDWKALLKQSDLMEVEVLLKREDGKLYKAIIRKCQRQIDQKVSWSVFDRDGFRCRYCNTKGPLTVDHLVLWEDGGPTTEGNLVSSCRKCNKVRGRIQYTDWLNHQYYKRVAENLTQAQRQINIDVAATLDAIEVVPHKRAKR
jgi:hypothetical protein